MHTNPRDEIVSGQDRNPLEGFQSSALGESAPGQDMGPLEGSQSSAQGEGSTLAAQGFSSVVPGPESVAQVENLSTPDALVVATVGEIGATSSSDPSEEQAVEEIVANPRLNLQSSAYQHAPNRGNKC